MIGSMSRQFAFTLPFVRIDTTATFEDLTHVSGLRHLAFLTRLHAFIN